YRVLYQGKLLGALLERGGAHLSVSERLGVFGDVTALSRSGKLPASEALALVPGLVKDGNRHLTGATLGLVGELADHDVPEALRPNYRRFIGKIYGARAHQLGWQPHPGEDDETRLLRPRLVGLVATEGKDKTLVADARKLTE